MKSEMKKCTCGGNLVKTIVERSGVKLRGLKCKKCSEVYFPSSEMVKYEIITGKSSLVRKIRKSGDSLIVTMPKKIVEEFGVHENDSAYFTEKDGEIKIRIIHRH